MNEWGAEWMNAHSHTFFWVTFTCKYTVLMYLFYGGDLLLFCLMQKSMLVIYSLHTRTYFNIYKAAKQRGAGGFKQMWLFTWSQ